MARETDVPEMQRIEVEAGRLFLELHMDRVAGDDPFSDAELRGYLSDDRAWVAVDETDRAIGYALALWVDGLAHLEQVSVHPVAAGRRLGAALIERVAAWGREHGSTALTLTTFADVPWNAPYYERLGFHRLPDAELTPGLRAIRAEEAAHGLDEWPRLAMRRAL
ncbi:GCN5 family N-acetyltransferase [Actinoplanes ianthinogenes]|uniref:GCN5 family N-acetyltransferase n=1 Tax=Actinoplanes ianthinogenes TaxID=122358 RepID=A0ABM7LXI5_9ACTN|nr:GCN5 family N-acetyltransferase [Actinoplanes ianthinogenes]GGR39738.1 GCN5 family N-acetyltransferase [Actinoplanes ianthinogenes]